MINIVLSKTTIFVICYKNKFNIVLSKTTIFVICYKNEFNYSVYNDFSRVSFTKIVIAVYLMM